MEEEKEKPYLNGICQNKWNRLIKKTCSNISKHDYWFSGRINISKRTSILRRYVALYPPSLEPQYSLPIWNSITYIFDRNKAPFTSCNFVTNVNFPIQQNATLGSKDLVGVRGLKIAVLCIHFTVISYSVECFTFVEFPSLRLLFWSQIRSTTFAYIYFKRRCLRPFHVFWRTNFR